MQPPKLKFAFLHIKLKLLLLYCTETSLIVTSQFVTFVTDIESSSRTNGEIQGLAALKPSRYIDNCFKKEVN